MEDEEEEDKEEVSGNGWDGKEEDWGDKEDTEGKKMKQEEE